MISYNIIINEEQLHEYKPDKNHIHMDILTIYENNTLKEGLNVYKIKKHHNTTYYYLELKNQDIIFHDVIIENQKIYENKNNGFIEHGINGYMVTYDYYETNKEIGLFDDDKETAKVIFELRKHDWNKKYFKDEYYPQINSKYKFIKKILNKYIVIKYTSSNEIYGIYNTIEEAKIKQDKIINNNWKIKEKIYTPDYLKEIHNKEKQNTEYYIKLKNQHDIPQKLYFHKETKELKELIEKFNGYIPPKGIYYYKNQRYTINQRRGYLEYYVRNLTYIQQLNQTLYKE